MVASRSAALGLAALLFAGSGRQAESHADPPAGYSNQKWGFTVTPPRFPPLEEKHLARIIAFFSMPPGDDASPGEEVWVFKSLDFATSEMTGKSSAARGVEVASRDVVVGSRTGRQYSWTGTSGSSSMARVVLVVQGKEWVHVIGCRAPAAQFEGFKAAFEKSLASFRASPDAPSSKEGPIYRDESWGFSLAPVEFGPPATKPETAEIARFWGPSQPDVPYGVTWRICVQPGSLAEFTRSSNEWLETLKRDKKLAAFTRKELVIDAHAAVEYVYSWDSMSCERPQKYLVVAIAGPTRVFMLMAEALESEFDKYDAAFRSSNLTFKLEK
jgi:hypothetical protein